ncbi:uncharacterized protein BDR25DRAFT_1386 [Lindgomyces ingoldianus]|uniref:Uncharacterized protein n=1 Tax=Lindgomyces ingoldianus TaxID=673940 RepID=A0ACB6RED5_9PLEO|nr:uncharacterized protein BDR25DRAFT_1386 [Lindgomyces ingoldianus]KAF2477482.1 hypothetical protein BDR25DRAFT_1386 [Lindgomyces ingoldianus]
MPLKGLRPNRSERDLQRRSTLDPAGLFRRSDKNKSSDLLSAVAPERVVVSEDGGRPTSSDVAPPSWSASYEIPLPSPPIQEHTPNTRRFSLMRFRHASDSQLSTKAKEHAAENAPPVPAMPAAPAIITTAPTMVDQEEPVITKRRGRLQQFSLRRRSFDPGSTDRPNLRKSMDKKVSSEIRRGPFSFMRSQNNLAEDPGRLSTSQRPDALTESAHESAQEGTSSLSLPVQRVSDSSRSDGSSAGHVSFEHTLKPQPTPKTGSGRFGFGRRNKQRASLFPLPMKIPPPEFPDTAPATPRASTSGVSSGSPHHSPNGESPPLTAIHHSRLHHLENGARTPPIPSPSQVALAAASLNLTSPNAGGPSLLRNDSTKSVRSSRSSPNAGVPMRLGLRGRSSTMGSLGGRSDDAPPPTPPYATSGRNSTSTAGRSSLSNLFGLSARFRQNSEPHSPRHGSPAHAFIGTPGISSHQNSLNISREALVMPEREEGETPGHYLERMEENNIERSVMASYLTKTDDPFMLAVLRSYMRKFAFFGDPIDMAIRKLLMQVELPKETQQIDRVLQGFADRYHECNPGIYINPDKAYFISFSIVILHTDFFNKNNKRKMQRNDYIKNSSCEGVSDDVLGCIYDNIVYTPFIHIEDELDLKGGVSRRSKKTAILKAPINDPARKATREPIDPYTLIFEGKLDALRPTVKDVMNLDDPYSYLGTALSLDVRNSYNSFSKYGVIQIVSSRSRPEAFMSQAAQENPQETSVGIVEMPVTKVGILWRKDTKRKKARSPWQEWGAVLTRSGLSLFRNSGWTKNLMHQHELHQKHGYSGPVVFQPPLPEFKQDHIIPMDGSVALVDNTYRKHKNAFVMFSKVGEETFLADSEKDLNDWLGVLNYSAAFETLGVRPRGLVGGLYEGQRNRGIRRLESSHSGKSIPTATGEVTIQSGKIDSQFAQQMMNARKELMQKRIAESEEKLTQSIKQLENRLRDARHLQILAPVQPKTRDLVIHAAGRLAAKLKWARIEIWRMKCHRDILAQELEDEKNVASERQARIDRIAGTSQSSQPQPSPQQSSRTSKISGLARLSSKASSLTAGQKPPLSPSASARPGTKSSRETDFGEDVFKTPPETSRQSSPNHPPAQLGFPPLSFSPQSSDHRASFASSAAQSPSLQARDHRPSVSTVGDRTVSSDVASDEGSQYTTPPPIEKEKAGPKTPDIPSTDGLRLDPESESEADQPPAALTGSPESRSKVRRSLHRTLRDSHGSSHRRGHKGRDSASTIVSDDKPESEGLSRAKGSFTVHGKKASVITFGAEWHNMPAEERLKVRKQAQEAVHEGGSTEETEGSTDDQARSVVSDSTATVLSAPTNASDDTTPRHSTNESRKQRHVSSQTITPANFNRSMNGHDSGSDDDSDMSEIEEESPTRERSSMRHTQSDAEDSGAERVKLDSPWPQVVEA